MRRSLIIGLIIISTALVFPSRQVKAVGPFTRVLRHIERENFLGATGATRDDGAVSVTPEQLHKELGDDGHKGASGPLGIFGRIRNFIKKNFVFGARMEGTILSIGTSSLSVKDGDGKTYQVNILSTTNLVRAFGGKSSLSEFSVNDKIMVFGKFTDSTDTAINANTIRDLSIQKRWGVFFGQITVLNSNNFVMKTAERGNQTVYFGTSKFVNRKEAIINYDDLKVGNRVRVKGVWDKTLNQISGVSQVKDFSLPVIVPTSAPNPTSTI